MKWNSLVSLSMQISNKSSRCTRTCHVDSDTGIDPSPLNIIANGFLQKKKRRKKCWDFPSDSIGFFRSLRSSQILSRHSSKIFNDNLRTGEKRARQRGIQSPRWNKEILAGSFHRDECGNQLGLWFQDSKMLHSEFCERNIRDCSMFPARDPLRCHPAGSFRRNNQLMLHSYMCWSNWAETPIDKSISFQSDCCNHINFSLTWRGDYRSYRHRSYRRYRFNPFDHTTHTVHILMEKSHRQTHIDEYDKQRLCQDTIKRPGNCRFISDFPTLIQTTPHRKHNKTRDAEQKKTKTKQNGGEKDSFFNKTN